MQIGVRSWVATVFCCRVTNRQRIGTLFRLAGQARLWRQVNANPHRAGQSPEGHRVTSVRRGLREPLPLAAALPKGGSERAKEAPPGVGHDPGYLDSRGCRRAFTLPSQSHPRPRPRWRASSGAEQGPGSHPWIMRGRFGTARADDPRNPGPIPQPASGDCPAAKGGPRRPLRFSSRPAATVRPSRGRSCQAAGQGS